MIFLEIYIPVFFQPTHTMEKEQRYQEWKRALEDGDLFADVSKAYLPGFFDRLINENFFDPHTNKDFRDDYFDFHMLFLGGCEPYTTSGYDPELFIFFLTHPFTIKHNIVNACFVFVVCYYILESRETIIEDGEPLTSESIGNTVKCIDLLLKSVNPSILTSYENSHAHYHIDQLLISAIDGCEYLEVISLLIEHGADPQLGLAYSQKPQIRSYCENAIRKKSDLFSILFNNICDGEDKGERYETDSTCDNHQSKTKKSRLS